MKTVIVYRALSRTRVALMIFALFSAGLRLAPAQVTVDVPASDNAFGVRSAATTVQGTAQAVVTKRLNDSNTRVAYLRFPVSQFQQPGVTVVSAALRVWHLGSPADSLRVYGLRDQNASNVLDSAWSSATLTWSNQPARTASPNDIPNAAGALPNTNTTPVLGLQAYTTAVGEVRIQLTNMVEFQNLLATDSNGEITLIYHNLGNNTPGWASISNTAGNPVPTLEVVVIGIGGATNLWTGSISEDWDLATLNWETNGVPAAFEAGNFTYFLDAAVRSSVNLTTSLSPAGVTVSNDLTAYVFSGPGRLTGSQLLHKRGPGTLFIANQGLNTYSGGTLIEGGSLVIGTNGVEGGLPANRPITNNATLIFNRSDSFSATHTIVGSGSVSKEGAGTLTLNGTASHSGGTFVNAGALTLNAINSGSSLSNASGTTLQGTGTNTAAVHAGGMINPGAPGAAGTLTLGELALHPGATIGFHANTTNTVGGAVNDLIVVNGNLTANGNTLTVSNLQNTVATGVPYRVINYTGSKTGTFGGVSFPGVRYSGTLDELTPNQINVTFTGTGPSTLRWLPAGSATWDVGGAANWTNLSTGLSPDVFYQADTVLFDDTATQSVVSISGTVQPAGITVANSTLNYAFSGPGAIAGSARLTKLGAGELFLNEAGVSSFTGGVAVSNGVVVFARSNTISGGIIIASNTLVQVGTNGGTGSLPTGNSILDGSLIFAVGADVTASATIAGSESGSILKTNAGILTISGANTFTGAVTVVEGTLRAGNASALGRTNLGTTLAAGTTLDVNAQSLGFEPIVTQGTGVGGQGAIVNNAAAQQQNALRHVTLLGDTTFGGISRWDLRDSPAGSLNAVLNGNSYTLRKISTNVIALVGVNATIGDIIVEQGILGIETGTTFSPGNIVVSNGAALRFFNNGVVLARPVTLNGNGTGVSAEIAAGSVSLGALTTVNGTVVFGGAGVGINLLNGIAGTANLIKTGSSRLAFNGAATYAGSTVVSNGTLVIDGGKSGGTGLTIEPGGVLAGGGSSIGEDVVVNGGISPGNPANIAQQTIVIANNLTMNNTTNLFELSPNPASGNDLLSVFGNLTLTGTNSFRISVTDHLNSGDVYTLVNWFGTGTGIDSNSIVIVPPTFGYEFVLIDPATTPGEIRIQVTLAIGFDAWLGNHPINPDLWDNGVTVNWLKAGVSAVFTNGDFAHFSDFVPGFVGSSTNINLVEQLTTAGVIFSNSTAAPFRFVGPGGLSGGGLVLEGEGLVTLANSGTNLWAGGALIDNNSAIFFNPASLMVGDGGLTGNLGSGTITNRGKLVFNRAGSLTASNVITGGGSITNMGSGIVTLSGSSTFTGQVDVVAGTLRAGVSSTGVGNGPFGSTNGLTVVAAGATLDVNMQNCGAERVIAGGTGVGNLGALVNNGTNAATSALQSLALSGNITVGGVSRWDVRNGVGQIHTIPTNSNYRITKVGTNQFSFVGMTDIDPNLGDVEIQQGTFAIQTTTRQLGNPTNTITVFSNASLNIWNLTDAPLNKRIVLNDGGTWWLENGTVTNLGPVILQGSNTFNTAGTRLTVRSNSVSGAGSIIKIGGGILELAGTNTYTGNTTVSNGTLVLIGATSLASSPLITLAASGAALDVSARTDGTLTINSARTLKGQGTIRGSLTVDSGGTLDVGAPLGPLSITNAVSLGGSTLMDLNGTTATSDRITNAVSITYGGTLTVSNLGATPVAGQTYRLFSAGSYNGSFSSITLPSLNGADYWTNNLAVNGSITVVSGIKPNPLITAIEIAGGNLVIRGTNNNGAVPGPVYILSSSNLTLPLAQWTVVATNAFDSSGNLNFTNGTTAEPEQFFILQVP